MDYIMFRVISDGRAFMITMLDFFGWYNISERDTQLCKELTKGDTAYLVDRPFTVARVN